MSVRVFGIRHHGPGCARSLRGALEDFAPDAVLVEGPPDAEDVLGLLGHADLVPPVALLVYPPDEPGHAVFYPFAEFSPEWQALLYARQRDVTVRFMDLPQSIRVALARREEEKEDADEDEERQEDLAHDPIGVLAEAAGYDDRELWWELQVERRRDATGLFEAILEAMKALRAELGRDDVVERRREAWMRQTIRAAQREGFERIAVVCGAWHAPVLDEMGTVKDDREVLKGLPRAKVHATWIPWTYSRLSYKSGYGAGVESPGWYQHVWASPEGAATRWLTLAARLLRGEDLDASSAGVIEAVRLAEALAALRELPLPGLGELREAMLTVLCHGETAPLALIHRRLEVGDVLGRVPKEAPTVPLQRDLEALQKRLRLKPTTDEKDVTLDLRTDTGRGRSCLLHRLRLLGVPWGEPQPASGRGTFKEAWRLLWQVEFPVQVIEASVYGNTVEEAATAAVAERGAKTSELDALTELLDAAVLAELPRAIEALLARLQEMAAVASDVRMLMDALPPLARVTRYGDVRGTPAERLLPVVDALFERVVVGLPGASSAIDDDAATALVDALGRAHESVTTLDRDEMRDEWHGVLTHLTSADGVHALVGGRSCRLLFEARVLDAEEVARRAGLALSPVVPPLQATAWLTGLLRGSGLTLLHTGDLWGVLDDWLVGLDAAAFQELLPLLRRAFSEFDAVERRQMGGKVKSLAGRQRTPDARPAAAGETPDLDMDRAARVVPVLAQILGVQHDG